MKARLYALVLLASASLAFGQPESNTITVTASRPMSLTPDEGVFVVVVTSSLTTGLDSILAAVGKTGITGADLASVNTVTFPSFTTPSVMGLQWSFVLGVPISMVKSTAASLSALQQTIVESGLGLAFQLQGSRVSNQAAEAQQCPVTDLLADAGEQAKKLADAALLSVGPVLAISVAQPAARTSAVPVIVAAGVTSTGTGTGTGTVLLPVPLTVPNPVAACSLTVKFTLYRYH